MNVDKMLAEISWGQFMEWLAFSRLEQERLAGRVKGTETRPATAKSKQAQANQLSRFLKERHGFRLKK